MSYKVLYITPWNTFVFEYASFDEADKEYMDLLRTNGHTRPDLPCEKPYGGMGCDCPVVEYEDPDDPHYNGPFYYDMNEGDGFPHDEADIKLLIDGKTFRHSPPMEE